jgi:hypothetical protein
MADGTGSGAGAAIRPVLYTGGRNGYRNPMSNPRSNYGVYCARVFCEKLSTMVGPHHRIVKTGR